METDRITPGQTANETTPAASDRQPGEAPKRDAITRVAFRRGLKLRPILGAGLLVLMVLSAGAYVYSVWDASQDIANRPKSAPTASSPPLPAPTATPAAATASAPSAIVAVPKSSAPPSEPTARQAPAKAQAPVSIAPVAAAQPAPAPPASLQQQPASLPKEEVVFVQKPGVRMRSEPGRHGKVIAGPPKGSQFKIVDRAGSWVRVEGDAGRGWIGGRMVGPRSP